MVREVSRRRGGIVMPLFLVAVGVLFLLNNLGMINYSVWDLILRFWPVLIIAIGVDVLLGRSIASGVIAVVGTIALVAVLLSLAAAGVFLVAPSADAATGAPLARFGLASLPVYSESIDQPLGDARRAEVNLSAGIGMLTLGARTEPDGLVSGTVTLDSGERLSRDYHVSGDTAYFKLWSENTPVTIGSREIRHWDLNLNPEVPIRLKISGGVGKSNLDLSRLQLSNLDLHSGVGDVEVTLPATGQLRANLEAGIGNTTIFVPKGVATRIRVEEGLGSISVQGNYQRNGHEYVSPGFDQAANRVDLTVKGGIGKITVLESQVQ